jgi:hypothetical protein
MLAGARCFGIFLYALPVSSRKMDQVFSVLYLANQQEVELFLQYWYGNYFRTYRIYLMSDTLGIGIFYDR